MNHFSSTRAHTRRSHATSSARKGYPPRAKDPHNARRSGRAALPAPATQKEDVSTSAGLMDACKAALQMLPIVALIGLLLLLVAAAIAYANADPDALITPLALSALGLTALLGGFLSARRGRRTPAMCGLIMGLLLLLCVYGASLAFGDESRAALTLGLSTPLSLALHACVVLLSLIGGVLGRRR